MPAATVYRSAHVYTCAGCGKQIGEGELYIAVRHRRSVQRFHVKCSAFVAKLMAEKMARTIYIHADGSTKPGAEPLPPNWDGELKQLLSV